MGHLAPRERKSGNLVLSGERKEVEREAGAALVGVWVSLPVRYVRRQAARNEGPKYNGAARDAHRLDLDRFARVGSPGEEKVESQSGYVSCD